MTTSSAALLKTSSVAQDAFFTVIGVFALALLAQVQLPLPFTPVPLTGQTFGVALLSLAYGARLGPLTVGIYLIAGALGLPVFAGGASGIAGGPTTGYLLGMWAGSFATGSLAARGWANTFPRAYAAAALGSLITFGCGLLWLSRFLPWKSPLSAGLLPFLPGDILKTFTAAQIASRFHRFQKRKCS